MTGRTLLLAAVASGLVVLASSALILAVIAEPGSLTYTEFARRW